MKTNIPDKDVVETLDRMRDEVTRIYAEALALKRKADIANQEFRAAVLEAYKIEERERGYE